MHDNNSNGKEIAYASFIVLEEITIWAGSIIDAIRVGDHIYGQKKSSNPPEFKIILQLNEKIKSIKFAKYTGSVITSCNLQVGADLNFEPNRSNSFIYYSRFIVGLLCLVENWFESRFCYNFRSGLTYLHLPDIIF